VIQVANYKEYLLLHPKEVQVKLNKIRNTILKLAPNAEEVISYGMPAFNYYGKLLFIAAYKKHIGLYPFSSVITLFKKELEPYHTSKGTIQFQLNEPIPYQLIEKIVLHRMQENAFNFEVKKKRAEKICKNGHHFYKTKESPTCPQCAANLVATMATNKGELSFLGAPARRALHKIGITTLKKLATLSKNNAMQVHGIGEATIENIKQAFLAHGLQFKK
jgi:uncharacterized protein YdhG (YjbR/CyaY superfamily)